MDLEEAIESASILADLEENYRITEYPKVKDPFEQLLEDLLQTEEVHANAMLRTQLGEWYPYYKQLKEIKDSKGVQARLPFIIQ